MFIFQQKCAATSMHLYHACICGCDICNASNLPSSGELGLSFRQFLKQAYTVYVQIFEGRNFRCFHGQLTMREIFILEISLPRIRFALIEDTRDTTTFDTSDDGKLSPY